MTPLASTTIIFAKDDS